MKERFTYSSPYGEWKDCYFIGGRYANGNVGIEIWNNTDGPIIKVTTNLGVKLSEDYIAVKDYSENVGMVKFLKNLGIISEEPVKVIESGFVFVPIYRLTEKGKEILFVK